MLNKLRKGLRKEEGFTLIELVVVVVILGILAIALVPAVVGRVNEAKANRYQSDLEAIATAARMYYVDKDGWPGEIDALVAYGVETGAKDPWNGLYKISKEEGNLVIEGENAPEGQQKTVPAPVSP